MLRLANELNKKFENSRNEYISGYVGSNKMDNVLVKFMSEVS